jgi:hypothetical protein
VNAPSLLFLKYKSKWSLCRLPLKGCLWPSNQNGWFHHRICCSRKTTDPMPFCSISKPLLLVLQLVYRINIPKLTNLTTCQLTLHFHAQNMQKNYLLCWGKCTDSLPEVKVASQFLYRALSTSPCFLCIMSLLVFFSWVWKRSISYLSIKKIF